jgi:hypothetical protein
MTGRLTAAERLGRAEAAHAELGRACEAHRRDFDMRLIKLGDELAVVKVELARTSTKVAILVGVLCTLGNLAISLLLRRLAP